MERNKSRICFFNSLTSWGGGEKFYLEYAQGLKNKGHDVLIITDPKSVLAQRAEQIEIPCQYVSGISTFSFLNLFKVRALIQLLRKETIDTIIFSTSQDLKFAGLAAKLGGIGRIVYRRGLATPIKGSFINQFYFSKVLTHIMANSEETKRTILKNLSSVIHPDKIRVIYNGVDIEQVKSKQMLNSVKREGSEIILGNAGRLSAQKGQTHLIDLACRLREKEVPFKIYIAGTGELENDLKQQIQHHGLEEQVILIGFVEDIGSFLNAIDIFVFPSIYEGFGYALVEAMIHEKPIVAFEITSNPEVVAHEKNALLAPYPNMELLMEHTLRLIGNPDLRNQFGREGLQTVQERFQLSDRINELEKYLTS